jgi:hypothetical protein
MLHPSSLAIAIIWKKFAQAIVAESSQCLFAEVEQLKAAMRHVPFNPKSEDYQSFLWQQNQRLQKLKQLLPLADWSEEDVFFAKKL